MYETNFKFMEQQVFHLSIPMKDGTTQKFSVNRNDIEYWLTEHNLPRLIDADDEKLVSNYKHAYQMEYNSEHPKPMSKRGGARQGAGRKAKGDNGTLRVGFRCSQDVYDILQQQIDMTAYIESAIRAYHRAYGNQK